MSSYDINPNSELCANDSKLSAISASSLIPLNYNTVDGRDSASVEVGSLFYHLLGFCTFPSGYSDFFHEEYGQRP